MMKVGRIVSGNDYELEPNFQAALFKGPIDVSQEA
jgi:hypothetical protein